jgi:EAL domain-containing protein (putative c-di-GMP-specific phosphodiesterase class I)/ActR/RegA family two-component response regulator
MFGPALNILVLDDEPFMVRLITQTLAVLGISNVTGCNSGITALELLDRREAVPDIIICDLNMPDMDGIEMIRQLDEHGYGGAMILVSGENKRIRQAAERLARAHQIPLLGHLAKPVAAEELRLLLAGWVPPASPVPCQAQKIYSPEAVRSAVANGELVNYYQPKVAVATGRVVGVEALVRWNHPEDGMVMPDQFIGITEEYGMIDDLTRIVYDNALTQTRTWLDAGLALKIAVNISMDSLSSPAFVNFIVDHAFAAGVAPQDVILEVTESKLMKDLRMPLEVVARMRMKRLGLSIDDFGTGHSSLAQLRDLPFDELKIDKAFVHGAWANDTLRAICEASHRIAQQLGMQVVAEGVEDQEDWDYLRHLHCDLAQGYFIARPMPAAALPGWMADWQRRVDHVLAERQA